MSVHVKKCTSIELHQQRHKDIYIAVKSEVEALIDTVTELIEYIEEYFEQRQK